MGDAALDPRADPVAGEADLEARLLETLEVFSSLTCGERLRSGVVMVDSEFLLFEVGGVGGACFGVSATTTASAWLASAVVLGGEAGTVVVALPDPNYKNYS